jgi:molecular chaperone GrpE
VARYFPRELGYPLWLDELAGPRRPERIAPRREPARRARRAPELDLAAECHRLEQENQALKQEAGSLREQTESLNAEVDRLRNEVETLKAEGERRDAELDDISRLAKQHRLKAVEAENEVELAKERIYRESAKEVEQKKRGFLNELLAVADDLDRALRAARKAGDSSALLEGVELVRRSFLAKLEEHGVRPDPAEGKPFDPQRHEAVSTAPVDEEELDGVVVAVVREGYLIGEETLRPANVVVGRLARPAYA